MDKRDKIKAFAKEIEYIKDIHLMEDAKFLVGILPDYFFAIPVLTMGPIGITPELKRQGYGKALLDFCLDKAAVMGFGAVLFEGNIQFYSHCGFDYAQKFGIKIPPCGSTFIQSE